MVLKQKQRDWSKELNRRLIHKSTTPMCTWFSTKKTKLQNETKKASSTKSSALTGFWHFVEDGKYIHIYQPAQN